MTAEDNQKIFELLREVQIKEEYWIGLTDQIEENKFVWTRSGKVAEYTNWEFGAPKGLYKEDCVFLRDTNGENPWNDLICTYPNLFVLCERGWSTF